MEHLINWTLLASTIAPLRWIVGSEQPIVSMFRILLISALAFLLSFRERKEPLSEVMSTAFLALLILLSALGWSDVMFAMPLIAYCVLSKQRHRLFLLFFPVAYLFLPPLPATLLLGFSIIAFQLRVHTTRKENLRKQYLQHIDVSTQQLLQLQSRNRYLSEHILLEYHNAQLKERNRIAREIHDNVGHKLTSAILQASALECTADASQKQPLSVLRETLQNAMEQIRESVHGLHDQSLSIANVLTQLTEEYTFCPVHQKIAIHSEPPREAYYALLAICREALTNTARHSNATQIQISLIEQNQFYHLLIADNGSVSSAEQGTPSHGLGLLSLEERVLSLGGQFSINHYHGFRIFARIPTSFSPGVPYENHYH